jgi:high-affinity nickel-transport protein
MTLASVLALGFLLGMRHATDADHVVAVSTIVARTRRFGAAWLLGAFWGAGHSLTIMLVGAAILLFKVTIPPRLGLSLEFFVGLVLVALGAANIAGARLWRGHRHAHGHDHGEHRHYHIHWLRPSGWRRTMRAAGRGRLLRSAAVGLAHGLAGSAAVALLALAAIPDARLGMIYLAVFGIGTLAGMLLLSAALELPMVFAARRFTAGGPWLALASGTLSLAFGLWVVYHTALVDGLFLAQAHWSPR